MVTVSALTAIGLTIRAVKKMEYRTIVRRESIGVPYNKEWHL
jgi:hypothetical protein